jgi:Topoisomerase IB
MIHEVDGVPERAAKNAGLRYTSDSLPGIRRRRRGGRFVYVDASGVSVRDAGTLDRIRRLAIPPAWEDVWICPEEDGHLQATGRDARGRKQYRYHAAWRRTRDEAKFDRMIAFGRALPKIRKRVARDLARRGLCRERVLATVVRLLETTLMRVGNDEYARDNRSYGLTTLQDRHAKIQRSVVTFSFRGKSGRMHVIDVRSKQLARIVRRCRDLPGYELFQYLGEDGRPVDVTSTQVNDYLREITDEGFTAKDFRTWAGTVLAARALQEFDRFENAAEAKRNLLTAIEAVARLLGNTPAICRRCYVHPVVLDTYLDGSLVKRLRTRAERKLTADARNLRPEEAAVLMLLRDTLTRRAPAAKLRRRSSMSRRAAGHSHSGSKFRKPRARGT